MILFYHLSNNMATYNQIITRKLYEYHDNETNVFKKKAYKTVINNIKDIDILSINDIDGIKGIGKSIRPKIDFIIQNNQPTIKHISFTDIYGIGDVTSKKLINQHNIKTIDELEKNTHLLNNKQKIGLKYYKDLSLRIPIKEMDIHAKFINEFLSNFDKTSTHSIVGSYRRKKQTSGDIDVLILSQFSMKDIVKQFDKYIIETLALSHVKFMGLCQLPNKPVRRIDMLKTTQDEFPYAQLYFTGSMEHNLIMRKKAKLLGYSLNEKNLDKKNENAKDVPKMKNEKDIFQFLDIQYKEPTER